MIKECRALSSTFFFHTSDAYFPKSGGNITGYIGVNNGRTVFDGYYNDYYKTICSQIKSVRDSNNEFLAQMEYPDDNTVIPGIRLYRRIDSENYTEIGQVIHTGNKSLITPADIGAPTVTEFNSLKTSVSEGKALIATAVTGKGVQTAADATFQTIAANINSIVVGTTGYTSVSDISDTVNVGGGGTFSMSLISFEKGLITIRCSGRVPSGYQISGYIYIQLA